MNKYTIRKNGALWEVVLTTNPKIVQFKSLNKGNCQQWVTNNE